MVKTSKTMRVIVPNHFRKKYISHLYGPSNFSFNIISDIYVYNQTFFGRYMCKYIVRTTRFAGQLKDCIWIIKHDQSCCQDMITTDPTFKRNTHLNRHDDVDINIHLHYSVHSWDPKQIITPAKVRPTNNFRNVYTKSVEPIISHPIHIRETYYGTYHPIWRRTINNNLCFFYP